MHSQSAADQVRKWLSWRKSEGKYHQCQPSPSPQVFCQVNTQSNSDSVTWCSQERRKLSFNLKELTTFLYRCKKKKKFLYVWICLPCLLHCVSCMGFVLHFLCKSYAPQSRLCPQAEPHFRSFSFTIKIHFPCFQLYSSCCCIKAQAYNALFYFQGW